MTNLIQIEASPTFQKNIRTLAKKYRNIRQDLQPVINQLEQGQLLGDQISGISYPVFKLRVKNSDIKKGKSGGYRLIYYLKTYVYIIF
jgi:mRNA-degrading endonuclease RelE of RelBE toxin-antitoxin system